MYKTLFAIAFAASLATPVVAGNWAIAVSDSLPGGGEPLKSQSWQFFLRNTGPGDDLIVLNATKPSQISSISIQDETKYKSAKRRARSFASGSRQIAEHLNQLGDGNSSTDVIGVLRHVALNRIDPSRPLDVMVIGSAEQMFPKTPRLSMRQEDGLYVPSPEHLAASVTETGYGMGAEGANGLANVFLHLCPTSDDLRSDEAAALQGSYAAYVAARGGALVTWSNDLPTCFARFAAEVRSAIEVAPYADPTGVLRMVKVGAAEVAIETEPTTVIVNGIEVEQFNIFASAPHPRLTGVEVTTGVVYQPGRYPDIYERAYCYFHARNAGSNLRLDLGNKDFGQDPVWRNTSAASLRAAGVTKSDFEAGRRACQWPTD